MAKMNLLKKFAKSILSKEATKTLKGGRSYEPNLTGSYGWVNWDDVDVRTPNFVTINFKLTKLNESSIS